MVHRLTGVTLLLAALLWISSCGGATRPRPSASPSPAQGIYGIAVMDPAGAIPISAQPSPLPDDFGKSMRIPVPRAGLVIKNRNGAVVARLRADSQGIFRVSLAPGTYIVWGTGDTAQKTTVVVSPGSYTRAVCYVYVHY